MTKPFDVADLPALRTMLEGHIQHSNFGGWWIDTDGFPVFVKWTNHSLTLRHAFGMQSHEEAYNRGLIRFSAAANLSTSTDLRKATRQAFRTISLALNLMGVSRYADRRFEASDDRPSNERGDQRNEFGQWSTSGAYPEDIIQWLRKRAPDGGFRSHTGTGLRLNTHASPGQVMVTTDGRTYSSSDSEPYRVTADQQRELADFVKQFTSGQMTAGQPASFV